MIYTVAAFALLAVVQAVPKLDAGHAIDGEYLVQFAPDARADFEAFKAREVGGRIKRTFEIGDSFMAASLRAEEHELLEVEAIPGVQIVEQSMYANLAGEQINPPWHLDRVDQRDLPLDQVYRWRDDADGTDVEIFVLDTGLVAHPDFNGRASFYADCYYGGACNLNAREIDQDGHGTFCGGITAASTYGVAKNATVYGVKVCADVGFPCSFEAVIGGIELVVGRTTDARGRIISASLAGGDSQVMRNAVNAAADAGVVSVIASGNSNRDACDLSPGNAEAAINVAAVTPSGEKAFFSNYGRCIDINAPGVDIMSVLPDGSIGVRMGTSEACPIVAGTAALIASRPGPKLTAHEIKRILLSEASQGRLSGDLKGSPNLLVFTSPAAALPSVDDM